MSTKEIDRGELIRRVREKRLTQAKAAALIRLSVRQVKRLCRRFKDNGLAGLVSRQRGQPSNRKLAVETKAKVVALVRERYSDFGPKLAHEKLVEVHGQGFTSSLLVRRTWCLFFRRQQTTSRGGTKT